MTTALDFDPHALRQKYREGRDKRDAKVYAQEIVRNFLQEEAMGGPEAELAMAEKFLPTISVAELNALEGGEAVAAGRARAAPADRGAILGRAAVLHLGVFVAAERTAHQAPPPSHILRCRVD